MNESAKYTDIQFGPLVFATGDTEMLRLEDHFWVRKEYQRCQCSLHIKTVRDSVFLEPGGWGLQRLGDCGGDDEGRKTCLQTVHRVSKAEVTEHKNNNYSMVYTPFDFSPHRAQLEEAFGKNLLRLAKSIPPPLDSR